MTSLQRFGRRLRLLRRKHALSQELLAEKTGLSQKYVSELERGMKSPSWQTLLALAHQGFDTSVVSLMTGVDRQLEEDAASLDALIAGLSKELRAELRHAFELMLRVLAR